MIEFEQARPQRRMIDQVGENRGEKVSAQENDKRKIGIDFLPEASGHGGRPTIGNVFKKTSSRADVWENGLTDLIDLETGRGFATPSPPKG